MKIKHLLDKLWQQRFNAGAVSCLFPVVTAPVALAGGIVLRFLGHEKGKFPFQKYTSVLLQCSVVLMGFGMHLQQVLLTGRNSLWITAISVTTTLLIGYMVSRWLKVDRKTGLLISCGTAICGGSAIAAAAPALKASENQTSMALLIVFLLNAIALFIFPPLGHLLGLSQEQFGYWSAVAIHDTSSVVGAGSAYGPQALEIATTVKLTRALWIIPVTFVMTMLSGKGEGKRASVPWFIPLFIVSVILAAVLPQWSDTFEHLYWVGRKGLVMAIFFIGASMSVRDFGKAGWRPLVMGVLLWIVIAISSILTLSMVC